MGNVTERLFFFEGSLVIVQANVLRILYTSNFSSPKRCRVPRVQESRATSADYQGLLSKDPRSTQ